MQQFHRQDISAADLISFRDGRIIGKPSGVYQKPIASVSLWHVPNGAIEVRGRDVAEHFRVDPAQ